ncbi:Fic family protein [Desulfosporosinus sp. Sb-LF]|uniref:Fic/DOC family protein n=1 Tax=Desulfosporosinus sp. Sb-LF TaxID=2560027 RepID=UPI0013054833|nr:Fic family protein [Desulfosporosinus sp. Sb-LF]
MKNEALLSEAELLFTTQRLLELQASPILADYNLEHLIQIHYYIFQDIYPFAGKTREEDISKDNTLFAHWQYLDQNANQLFRKLKEEGFLIGTNVERFSLRSAFYMSELNILHPFREGNGRVIREYIRCLAIESDYVINWNVINKDTLLRASIMSVYDIEPLSSCIRKTIEN